MNSPGQAVAFAQVQPGLDAVLGSWHWPAADSKLPTSASQVLAENVLAEKPVEAAADDVPEAPDGVCLVETVT